MVNEDKLLDLIIKYNCDKELNNLKDILDYLNINIIPVGRIEDGSGIYLEKDGYLQKIDVAGYEHFNKNGSI